MDYREAASWAAERMQSYRKDCSGWRSCKRTNEVSISWRPSTEFHGNIYKAEGIMPAKPEDVFKCLKPETGGLREKWDPNVKEIEVVEEISEDVSIVRTITPSAFMKIISPREFIDVVLIKRDEDGTITSNATNVEHPLCQLQPSYVRGLNYPCGCFCIPAPGEPCKTQLLTFFQTDLGGNLPQTVVESFFPSSMTGFYSNLTKAVLKLAA
ncbi:stAR-related lipid transfer protein 5 [Podarcis raffonei]|uniref:stAR-related lipid transfer protein 5 n=1 Tax=Podarcis raffonei TaxID=65483 RepID=UPI0023291167|nr:stAR-related lipid transfer protein 5 [Podarcis raffonei]